METYRSKFRIELIDGTGTFLKTYVEVDDLLTEQISVSGQNITDSQSGLRWSQIRNFNRSNTSNSITVGKLILSDNGIDNVAGIFDDAIDLEYDEGRLRITIPSETGGTDGVYICENVSVSSWNLSTNGRTRSKQFQMECGRITRESTLS